MTGPWSPPESERAVGRGFYLTATPGIAARLKRRAEDFRVQEISAHPAPDPDGPYTVLRVASRNWEQHELSRRLAREIGLAPSAIRWAGTKDRRAVAERLASYHGPPPTAPLHVPDVELLEVYRAREGLVLGHHFGNAFEVRLSFPHSEATGNRVALDSTLTELRAARGFPNLFGLQRFGEVRPITHEVGRALLRGDVAGAVEVYLTALPPGEDTLGIESRRAYLEHHDAARALREFPPAFTFERQMLEHLARGHPPERAIRSLARELRLLFVHAYQSRLFNDWVSERFRRGLSLNEPEAGDFVLRTGRDGTVVGRDAVAVGPENLQEVLETVRRGGARLAGPLVGYDTPAGAGTTFEILEALLARDGIERSSFRLPLTPDLASAGAWRPVWVDLPPIGVRDECDPPRAAEEEHGLWLKFALPKGSYATVLLREVVKAGATRLDGASSLSSRRVY